jgi:hypothetical protein
MLIFGCCKQVKDIKAKATDPSQDKTGDLLHVKHDVIESKNGCNNV